MENHNEPHHLHFVNLEFQSHQRLISNNCLKRQKSLVNLFQTRFAFASQIDYLCRRESVQKLSLFSCLNATKNIKSLKVLAKSYEISIQHASNQPMKCVRLQAYMT